MATPTSTIQRRELGELASEYALEQSRNMFTGLSIMPIMGVPLRTGNYTNIPIEEMLKPRDVKRAPKSNYNRGDWGFEQLNYTAEEYGWEEVVDDSEARDYSDYFSAEQKSTMIATDVVLRAQEARIAAIVEAQKANNVSVAWSTPATATPLADVETGIKTIMNATGVMPDTLHLTWQSFKNALKVTEVQDALKYTAPMEVLGYEAQKQALATYFGVSRIVVANSINNGAKEGATFSASQIWSDSYGFLCVTSMGSFDQRPSFGKSMLWTGDSPTNVVVESYRDEEVRGNVIRVRHYVDELVLNSSAGYLLGNLA